MKNSNSNPNEGTADNRGGVRPDYIELGTDTAGASHIYRTFNETIVVVQNGESTDRFDVADVDDYVTFARDEVADRDWANRSYFADDEWPFTELVNNVSTRVSA